MEPGADRLTRLAALNSALPPAPAPDLCSVSRTPHSLGAASISIV